MAFKLDKIYTKSGDKGLTYLIGGKKVPKSDIQVECYGAADELNTFIGMIRTELLEIQSSKAEIYQMANADLMKIQNDLFDLGSVLATVVGSAEDSDRNAASKIIKTMSETKKISEQKVLYLEGRIDEMNKNLETLRSFTLPGGGKLNAWSHIARANCRSFERLLIRWGCCDEIDSNIIPYVNRLSDYLFVFSRWIAKELGEKEFLWETPLKDKS